MKQRQKRLEWVMGRLRAVRLRIEAERVLEGLPSELLDEELCILVDIAHEFGLDEQDVRHIVGWVAYDRVAGSSGVRLMEAMGERVVVFSRYDLQFLLSEAVN